MRLVLIVIAAVGVLIGAGCHSKGQSDGAQASLLFVQTAESVELRPTAAEGVYQLRLNEPAGQVVYFTDRPQRRSGTVGLDEFLTEWQRRRSGFKDDPPNAALSLSDDDVLVFELTDPVREGTSLRYTVKLLRESTRFKASSKAVSVPTGPIDGPALFIDNIYLSDNPSSFTADPMNAPDPAYGNPDAYRGPVHVTPMRWREP